MENGNRDFRNKTNEEELRFNEIQSKSEEKLPDNNISQASPSVGNLDETRFRKDDKLTVYDNKNIFQNKSKDKDLTIPILISIVALIFVGVVIYYLNKKDSNFLPEDPQQIIMSSMETMNGVNSYALEGNFNFNLVKNDDEKFSLAMKFDGKADEKDSSNTKSLFNIKPQIDISREGGSESIFFDFSTMSIGETGEEMLYLKLNDFDLGAAGIVYGEMIVPYKNIWYFLDIKELQEKSGYSVEENFNSEKIISEIKNLLGKYKMIKFQEDLGDVKLGNIETYHYKINVDSEAVLNFYVELFKIIPSSSEFDESELESFNAELEENRTEIIEILDEIMNNTNTEIWIGKTDKMIYKISISGEFDDEFSKRMEERFKKVETEEDKETNDNLAKEDVLWQNPEETEDSSFGAVSFEMSIMMSNFNEPIEIVKPEEAEDLVKILEEMTAGIMGGMLTPNPDLGPDFDEDGLDDNTEKIYGTDINNPDTDGDGYLDGDEVKNGYDPTIPGDAKLDYDKLFEK